MRTLSLSARRQLHFGTLAIYYIALLILSFQVHWTWKQSKRFFNSHAQCEHTMHQTCCTPRSSGATHKRGTLQLQYAFGGAYARHEGSAKANGVQENLA
jgi:hypothetical protein